MPKDEPISGKEKLAHISMFVAGVCIGIVIAEHYLRSDEAEDTPVIRAEDRES